MQVFSTSVQLRASAIDADNAKSEVAIENSAIRRMAQSPQPDVN
jgi:hypothetical protein